MQAPQPYKLAGQLNIAAGVINIILGILCAIFCYPLFVNLGIGVWQVMVGREMNQGVRHPQAKKSLIAGIVAGALLFNLLVVLLSAFGLLQLSNEDVIAWMES